ncbi:MAG: nitrogenase component 1 [Eubacterium sp.]|nr:nitrogenase component 1 [Eubacterium sp.]
MTENYLTNITPDSLSGLIFAFEGVSRSIVLMNGPTGCKFYHSATSDNRMIRQPEFDPLEYPEFWYFGQPRVPSTYLDKRDYVYGSEDKLHDAIVFLKNEIDFDLLAIVNTPGAALIGDDLVRISKAACNDKNIITFDSPGYSLPIWNGYIKACELLINRFAKEKNKTKFDKSNKSVNILGLSIYHRDFAGDKIELETALRLCGIDVNCFLCSGSGLEDIENIPQADLNIVLDPIYGTCAAKLLAKRFDMPYIVCDGLPIGFTAMETLILKICEKLNCSAEKFIVRSEKARAKCFAHLSRIRAVTGLPKGVKFAVHGTISQCLGYTDFISKYFGMIPDSVSVVERTDDAYISATHQNTALDSKLSSMLNGLGFPEAEKRYILDTDAELVFADGQTIAMLKAKGKQFCGVEISLPSLGYVDVIEKTHLGVSGGLLICEQIINGMLY